MNDFHLEPHGITVKDIRRNVAPARLYADAVREDANCVITDTGWSGGSFGVGKRLKLSLTRAMIDGIHSGDLAKAPRQPDPVFGLDLITQCPGVPPEVLIPRDTWSDRAEYDATAHKLAHLFRENFRQYMSDVRPEVREAGPHL